MKSSGDPASRPLAILSAPGSRGDVNPMIAIGCALRRRGWDAVISLAEPYAAAAAAAGLAPQSLISQQRFDQLLAVPSVWKPVSGVRAILQEVACEFLRPHFDLITRLKRPGRTVLVSHPLDFASRIHRDLDPDTPLVDVFLSPAMIRSSTAPPRLSPWRFEPRRPAWLVNTAYWLTDHLLLDRFLAGSINRLRRDQGLTPVRRIMDRWWLSPDLILGLYPDWFGDAVPATAGRWQTCGFPLTNSEPPARLEQQRQRIFFTPGTAHRHAQQFFAMAVEASEALGRPAILATSHAAQIPANLPPAIQTVGYVPLDQVLPQCAAIVHHGGIGTTAQAIAAACPQLILPMAFDQFHNAEQIVRLGLGSQLLRPTAKRLSTALAEILDDPQRMQPCLQAAERVAGSDGAEVVAQRIAEILGAKL